jgi:nucleoid-associated protein YgaU
MYRSTLDVPPPPLLDSAVPAPLAVSTARERAAGASIGGVHLVSTESALTPDRSASLQPTSPPSLVPSIHVVRDGDDLTSIATAIYGHPGAAEAIWNANRDRLSDPGVLPIGMTLRIPSSWVPPAARAMGAGGADLIEPGQRPARVRVAPGETFESLAVRFYGDRAWASRLWEANRDQVRSPALLVAGIELRLP